MATINGTTGNDLINGTAGYDFILGSWGVDTLLSLYPLQLLIIGIVVSALIAAPIVLQSEIGNQDTSIFENCPYDRVKI